MAPHLETRRLFLAVSLFGIAEARRLDMSEQHTKANATMQDTPQVHGDDGPVYATDGGVVVHRLIEADHMGNRLCHLSVKDAVVDGDQCKCERGSYIVGEAPACRQAEQVTQFLPLHDFALHGCRCEELGETICGSRVEGAVLRNSYQNHLEDDGEQCKCPSGSWVTGHGVHCNPEGDRVRKFNALNFDGCHCQWNYNHLPNWREHIEAFWHDLMQTENPNGIERRCHPYIEGSGEKGVVLLMHGATACSGWWYLMKDHFIRDGYMVVVTTHIGHGRAPEIVHGANWRVTDYLADMPVRGKAFIDYADELNRAMKKYKNAQPDKELIIVGHSIGGALSTNMIIEEPHLWNRALLMNPFYAPSQLPAHLDHTLLAAVVSVALPTAQWVMGEDDIRWSEGCDAIRLDPNGGHGGMCHFTWAHLGAWFQLGDIVQRKSEAIGAEHGVFTGALTARAWGVGRWVVSHLDSQDDRTSPVQVQILTSAGDPAVENANVHFASRMFHAWANGGSSFCVFPEEFTHSWIAPVDFPWIDHWWLDRSRTDHQKTAIDLVVDFVRDGAPVPTKGTVPEEEVDAGIVDDDLCDIHQVR